MILQILQKVLMEIFELGQRTGAVGGRAGPRGIVFKYVAF